MPEESAEEMIEVAQNTKKQIMMSKRPNQVS
jgi:hypothetical protein